MRWHLAVLIPRLQLTAAECQRFAATLQTYLEDRSSIVKTFALQGLADMVRQDPALHPAIIDLLRLSARNGTAAMRARARILLRQMEEPNRS